MYNSGIFRTYVQCGNMLWGGTLKKEKKVTQ